MASIEAVIDQAILLAIDQNPALQLVEYRNELLRRMSSEDLALLKPHLQRCRLDLRAMLETSLQRIEAVYFIEAGLASVVAKLPDGGDAEIGFIGFEGMTGSALVMGDDRSIHECYVQIAGEAFRIDAVHFCAALEASSTLRALFLRYVQSLHIQTGFTALVTARNSLEQRLSRWLLMCDDRVTGDTIPITHDFLATMLGVRRPGVTVALQMMEGRALIRAKRGEITIRNREGILALANGGYGGSEAEYFRLLGPINLQ